MRKVVAIHQPNFFPWLGYVDMIVRSDVFVFLDHVQFPKTGGIWSNRVRLRVSGEARWVTAPIRRAFHGVMSINQIVWADAQPWREKLLKTLRTNYGRAPYFHETMELIVPLVQQSESNLARYNMHAGQAISTHLGIGHGHCVISSELDVDGEGTDLLIDITLKTGGTAYLCGGGAEGYQDDERFTAAGVELVYQGFVHPVYAQTGGGNFVPGLSIIDAMMNCGRTATCRMLGGRL
jgi:hypothetical protein